MYWFGLAAPTEVLGRAALVRHAALYCCLGYGWVCYTVTSHSLAVRFFKLCTVECGSHTSGA